MSIPEGVKVVAVNRRARFDYSVDETFECGICLLGTEVKSIKDGKVSFPDAFAEVRGQRGMDAQLPYLGIRILVVAAFQHDPDRLKKLLLHAQEIKRIDRRVREKGYTLIPLSIYLKRGLIKIELGLCKGKKMYDKRSDIRERDIDRDMRRDLRRRNED